MSLRTLDFLDTNGRTPYRRHIERTDAASLNDMASVGRVAAETLDFLDTNGWCTVPGVLDAGRCDSVRAMSEQFARKPALRPCLALEFPRCDE